MFCGSLFKGTADPPKAQQAPRKAQGGPRELLGLFKAFGAQTKHRGRQAEGERRKAHTTEEGDQNWEDNYRPAYNGHAVNFRTCESCQRQKVKDSVT